MIPNEPTQSEILPNHFSIGPSQMHSPISLLPIALSWVTEQMLGFAMGLFYACACFRVKHISYFVGGRVGMGVTHSIVRSPYPSLPPKKPNEKHPPPPLSNGLGSNDCNTSTKIQEVLFCLFYRMLVKVGVTKSSTSTVCGLPVP